MSPEIITAIITGVTTLLVSLGTWHVTMKQYRLKNMDIVVKAVDEVKDTFTATVADMQNHLSIIDYEIKTLSERVDKHNNLIERTYDLEKRTDLQDKDIAYIKEKLQ